MNIEDYVLGPDGSIVLIGTDERYGSVLVERYSSNGILDDKFGTLGRLKIPNSDSEDQNYGFSGFIQGKKLFVYGAFGSIPIERYPSSHRIFLARIKY